MNTLKKKGLLALVVLLAVVGLVLGCGNGEETGTETGGTSEGGTSEGGTIRIEAVAKGFQHDFWTEVRKGAEQAAEEEGVEINFVGPKNETAIAEQVEMLNNAVNKNPDAILLAALDTQASLDAINQAMEKGIPIVGFDSGVPDAPEGAIVATASTDNYAAGGLAAEHIFEAAKDKILAGDSVPRIGVVAQDANSMSISERSSGFIDKMIELIEAELGAGTVAVTGHDKYNNNVSESAAKVIIEIRIPAQAVDSQAQTEAQTLLEKNDLIAIFGSNEFSAKAIINADNALGGRIGPDKVLAAGFDSGTLQIDAVRSKRFLGSVTQDPINIGYQAVKLAVKAINGEEVADIDTGAKWYDASNIDSDEIQPLLYE